MDRFLSPSSRGLGHHPFTVSTGVRIPLGTPIENRFDSGFAANAAKQSQQVRSKIETREKRPDSLSGRFFCFPVFATPGVSGAQRQSTQKHMPTGIAGQRLAPLSNSGRTCAQQAGQASLTGHSGASGARVALMPEACCCGRIAPLAQPAASSHPPSAVKAARMHHLAIPSSAASSSASPLHRFCRVP